jgi:hypothetical protein
LFAKQILIVVVIHQPSMHRKKITTSVGEKIDTVGKIPVIDG